MKKEEDKSHIFIHWKENSQENNNKISFVWPYNWKIIHHIESIVDGNFGEYIIRGSLLDDKELIRSIFTRFSVFVFFLILVVWILWPLYYRIPHNIILKPIAELLATIDETEKNNAPYGKSEPNIIEINLLKNKIISMVNEIRYRTRESVALNIAQQVAHDIRSPILALESLHSISFELSLEKRNMIRTIVKRMNSIINNLSDITHHSDLCIDPQNNNDCFIYNLLSNILEEKKLEYYSRDIIFSINISRDLIGVSSNIDEEKFERCISNILNNSIEALNPGGVVILAADLHNECIHISISDNGKGIPADQIDNIFLKGFSFNKKNGKGLGLTFAKECIESFGGKLQIKSCFEQGTVVDIFLNARPSPDWLCKRNDLSKYNHICVLDDEEEIHELWYKKLVGSINKEKIMSFYDSSKFIRYLNKINKYETLFLIDYQIAKNELTGLQIITDFNLQDDAFLVTGYYADKRIISECVKNNIKIIPKILLSYITIN
ncbi:hypothetical protein A8135_06455 [Legionella jamestowniensis]|uniref:histidine kinase n=1 Tax=Legionella jamestowniensis TaxID=455 RepID=A0ABX2XS98_9GAMM|nr:HAMP domain-containing sensor histidine kinase [Legionella jamestowniensis]OCH96794.1 hypothetical protein A8135_06455 [Legionella jamestowniensis]